jgi:hypothetical protein
MSNFIEQYLKDPTLDIDDSIDHWHNTHEDNLELHEYLGFTWLEWGYYVESGDLLGMIERAKARLRQKED